VLRVYLLAFDSSDAAKRFVIRLHMQLRDVATFRSEEQVLVYDASDKGQRARVMQLARESGVTWIRPSS